MTKQALWKNLLLLVALIGGLTLSTLTVYAQETGATGEAETSEDAAEGVEEGEDLEGEVVDTENQIEETEEGETAAEEAVSPLTPLGINGGFLIAQIVNFVIIFLLLRGALWNPLRNLMDSRGATIQKGLEDAAAAANARRNAETDVEKIMTQARADAARLVEEARTRGDEVSKGAERTAREEAERIRTEARAASTEERNRQLAELRGQVAAIGVAVAERLVGSNMDQGRQQTLINNFFAQVPADAHGGLQGDVEVVSAMPLEPGEQDNVRREVGAQTITFTVDPSILGGLIIRSSDRVIDGSVRSGLTDLAGRLR